MPNWPATALICSSDPNRSLEKITAALVPMAPACSSSPITVSAGVARTTASGAGSTSASVATHRRDRTAPVRALTAVAVPWKARVRYVHARPP